jgi:hypothetical protein
MAGCGSKKYAKGGMATRKAPKKFADGGMVMQGQQVPDAARARFLAANPLPAGAGGTIPAAMGSMGKANPYSMGPGGREYESAMDKQSNQMPVPQRGPAPTPPRPAPAPVRAAPAPVRPAPAPVRPAPAPMRPGKPGRAFKKGGMVNAGKTGSSVRPRGSSGKGVKACKVC